jgi:hypothetical protein
VTKLHDQVKNALDEGRTLLLGVQVLLGFGFRIVFERKFVRLPYALQVLKLYALALLLVTIALLLWPTAFHRLVEHGNSTNRMRIFATRAIEAALFPFAVALSIDLFIAVAESQGTPMGMAAGGLVIAAALVCWYGFELIVRKRRAGTMTRSHQHPPDEQTDLSHKVDHVLTETRVLLPGAQALLGFQLIAIFTAEYEAMSIGMQQLHLASLGAIAATVIILMTPAAYHRIVENGENTEAFHRFASRMLVAAMVPLALGICGDLLVVVQLVTGSSTAAIVAASVALAMFYGMWFGVPLITRERLLTRSAARAGSH